LHAAPTSGSITVTIGSGNTLPVVVSATRFAGADTSGANGSGAIEAVATNAGPPVTDDKNMKINVTTLAANAWAYAAGTHRLATFTVPPGETAISINNTAGSSGDTTKLSTWYEAVPTPGTVTLGADNDLSSVRDWAVIAVSIKPGAGAANAAPSVALTSPANNATFTAPASIVLTADAQDTDGTVAQVEFFQGAVLVATDTTAPFTFTLTNVAAGSYTFTARATDNLGTTTTSAAVNVTVNPGVAQLYFIHSDHLNTPRVITNQAAQVVWRWDQTDPFGGNVPNENPSGLGAFTCNLRLPGQYFDKETNLHYNYHRWYDPAIGRFPQPDPLGITTTSRATPTTRLNHSYAYVDSNPLSWTDPLGLVKWSGQSKSFVWLAYSRDEFELESECKCGVKARIRVFVDSLGRGVGASATRSAIEFEDHFACPNPMAFAGPAVIVSATAAVRFGASYSRAQVAAARSSGGWSAVEGLGASMGVSVGNARVPVEDIQFETCQCEKK